MMRFISQSAAALCAVLIAADASNALRTATNFTFPVWVITTAIAVVCIVTIVSALESFLMRNRAKHRDEISVAMTELLFPLWYQLTRSIQNKTARKMLGVNIWLVPPWYARITRPAVRNRIPRSVRSRLWTPYLWRVSQLRIKHLDVTTGISWKRDKGVIGKCWRAADRSFWQRDSTWGEEELLYAQWEGLSEDARLGLDYAEYLKIRRKYGSAIALPIYRPKGKKEPQFIGCLTVDLPPGFDKLNLDSDELRAHIVGTINLMVRRLEKWL